jgi:hypothetical protein
MNKQEILDKIEIIRDKLRLYLILDDLMRKDPVYKLRCKPECPSYIETDWNTVQIKITYLQDKIDKYMSNLNLLKIF